MEKDEDKFKSGTVFIAVYSLVAVISPVLLVMYFVGHKEFVLNALKLCLVIVVFGPIINFTGIYKLVSGYIRYRDNKKWSKINKKAAERVRQKERSKALKNSRLRDPKLPKDW